MPMTTTLTAVPVPEPLADTGANRDPLSGEVGAHPVGVGLGAAAGGIAVGAALGSVAGPIGTTFGAIFGAVAGGLVGKGAAEIVEPTAADAYWRANYAQRAYARDERSDDDREPAQANAARPPHHHGRDLDGGFNEIESELPAGWETVARPSEQEWAEARLAALDAWDDARRQQERSV